MFSDNPQALGIETDRLDEIKSYYSKFMSTHPDFVFLHESWRYTEFLESMPRHLRSDNMYSICTLYTEANFVYLDGKYIYKTEYELLDLMMTIMKMHILNDSQWHKFLENVECFDFNEDYEEYKKKLLKTLNRFFYGAHMKLSDISHYIVYEFREDGMFSDSNVMYNEFASFCERIKMDPVVASCCKAIYDETNAFVMRWRKSMPTLYHRIPNVLGNFLIEKNDEITKKELEKRIKYV